MKLLKPYFLLLFLLFKTLLYSQKKDFKIHTIAFYNLENLFDTINDPNKFDEYSPIMELKSNRHHVYQKKVQNMAQVIADIGKDETKNSPVLLGICEIENRIVLENIVNDSALIAYDYGIIHNESPDIRGIDVALLYQKKLFVPTHNSSHELKIYDNKNSNRVYTRNQLLVSGKLDNDLIHIIINHWPSRRGGEASSEPKRIAAAKLNKRLIDSLQSVNPYGKILVMGDFNDNPTNKSIKHILNATSKKDKVPLKGIYNPFANFYRQGLGTTAYRDSWSLFDQIMLTQPLLKKDYDSYRLYKAGIYNKKYITSLKGPYKGYPYRSWSQGGFSNGYSDHFPVYVFLIKAAP